MIAHVHGKLASVAEDHVVIEAGGLGYQIYVTPATRSRLPAVGDEVTLYTHFQLREDGMFLYGFDRTEDRAVFTMLLGVSGVGPKVAMGIMAASSADQLLMAIRQGDIKKITALPGVGKKLAERLLLELRDKVGKAPLAGDERSQPVPAGEGVLDEAVAALVALGYSAAQAGELARTAWTELGRAGAVEDIVRYSLKRLGGNR